MTTFTVGILKYLIKSQTEVTVGDESSTDKIAVVDKTKFYKEIIIPKKVTYNSITYTVTRSGEDAFKNIKSKRIFIPNTIKSIGMNCFMSSNIWSIYFEEGSVCTKIEAWGLMVKNKYFRRIVLPSSITSLNDYVFWCLIAPLDVYYCGSNSLVGNNMDSNDLTKIKAHVSSNYPLNTKFLKVDPIDTNANCAINPYPLPLVSRCRKRGVLNVYLLLIQLFSS